MALQIWLPLNGDLHNQGLNQNAVITKVDGALSFTSGKIGQGLSCNGSTYWTITPVTLTATASICWWAKTGTNAKMPWVITATSYASLNFYCSNIYTLNTGDGNENPFKNNGSDISVLNDNNWHHFAVTFGSNICKLYIDGSYRGTATTFKSPATTSAKMIKLAGGFNNAHTYDWNGILNDFRIYDHCLTEKEIEEISKGLVLHYKLNWETFNINPNLLPDTNVSSLTKVNGPYDRYYESVSGGSYTKVWETISDPPAPGIQYGVHYKVTTASGFHGVTWYANNGLFSVTAEPYTLSCYAKKISSGNVTLKFQYGKSPYVASPAISMINDNEWHQYSWTFTPNIATSQAAAGGTTRIYGAGPSTVGEVIICGWKLEKGSIATQWIEKDASPIFPNTIIQDCSGYQNNGTIVGNLTAVAGSPRYNVATKFSGSGNYIKRTPFYFDNQDWTVSLWYYNPTAATSAWESFLCLSKDNGSDANKKIALLFNNGYADNIWCKINSGNARTIPIKVNEWTQLTLTSEGKLYENGILKTSISPGANITGAYDLVLGARASAAGITNTTLSYGGKLSDVRIYATALSAAAVKELYNTSMIVNSNGTVSPRELVDL